MSSRRVLKINLFLSLATAAFFLGTPPRAEAFSCNSTLRTGFACLSDGEWARLGYKFDEDGGENQTHSSKENFDLGSGEKKNMQLEVRVHNEGWLGDYGNLFAGCFKKRVENMGTVSCAGKKRTPYFAIDKKITIKSGSNFKAEFSHRNSSRAGDLAIVFTTGKIHSAFLANEKNCKKKKSSDCVEAKEFEKSFDCDEILPSQMISLENVLKSKLDIVCASPEQKRADQLEGTAGLGEEEKFLQQDNDTGTNITQSIGAEGN